jgi:arginine repressor
MIITEETLLVEMRIWCIKIGNVLVLHSTPGRAKYLGTYLIMQI